MKTKKGQNWPVVRWLLKVQLALTVATALLTGLLSQGDNGWFVMLGGIVAMALTLIAALRTFAVDAQAAPGLALTALYRGQAAKIIGAVLFFLIVAKTMPEKLPFTLIGFVAATLSYWISLLWAPLSGVQMIDSEELEDR